MKKFFCFLFIITVCFTVIGCQESATNNPTKQKYDEEVIAEIREKAINGINIYDFEFINEAPKSKEKHLLQEVIKVYFNEGSYDSGSNPVAIDVANEEIYRDPRMSSLGVDSNKGSVRVSDAKNVINILKKHTVQEWKNDYTFQDPGSYQDGYGWSLRLQFEDGTVEIYHGQGTDKDKITPKNFEEFAAELNRFVHDRLKEK